MPAYRRRGTYSSRRRRYTYRRRYPARRTYRRAYRYIPRPINMSQRSRTSVMFRDDATLQINVPVGSRESEMAFIAPLVWNSTGAAALSTLFNQSIINNTLFNTYRGLYEQMKIERVVWYITGITTVGVNGQQPALRLISAIDRCVHSTDLYQGNRWAPIDVLNASTAVDRIYTNNSRVKLARYCLASDITERNAWTDTDVYTTELSNAQTGLGTSQRFRSSGIFTTSVSGFNPMLAIVCQIPDAVTGENPLPIRFFLQQIVTMSFRNPRGVSQSEAKIEEAQKKAEEIKATQEPIKWEEFEQPDPVNVT